MKIGTKSVLYGAHQFAIHPWFVAYAWWKLHGFKSVFIGEYDYPDFLEQNDGKRYPLPWRRDAFTSLWHWKLWLAFFIHDLGYLGKPNMDGPEGEQHPYLGARIMYALGGYQRQVWHDLLLYHSRFLAKQNNAQPSVFCIADKLAIVVTWRWLYMLLVRSTGEVAEYMERSQSRNDTGGKYVGMNLDTENINAWYDSMIAYMKRWIEEHKDGRADTWTPAT